MMSIDKIKNGGGCSTRRKKQIKKKKGERREEKSVIWIHPRRRLITGIVWASEGGL
jgi:hypothetical protein